MITGILYGIYIYRAEYNKMFIALLVTVVQNNDDNISKVNINNCKASHIL